MKYTEVICFLFLALLITLFSLDIGVFWDNVIYCSQIGDHLYRNDIFEWQSIPLKIDNAQPPFVATLLAISWTLFGKTLEVSHWVMFPFIFGLLCQLYLFVSFFIKNPKLKLAAFILVIADPTLLSQFVLINSEIVQLFFFFLSLNAVLRNKFTLKFIGLSLLGIVTYRGMMLCAGVFVIDALIFIVIKKQKAITFLSKKNIATYLTAAIPALLYIIWRLATKGWLISHPTKMFGNAWGFTSILDFLKNFGRNFIVLGHQFTDFGRITVLVFIGITLIIKRKVIFSQKNNYLLIISIFSTVILYGTSLIIKNTMGHRYYIASYLPLALLAFHFIEEYTNKKSIYSVLLASLLLGNFIVYPDAFAQGWDASLAHLPYWNLRRDAIQYMEKENIPFEETASFFPNIASIDDIDLNGDKRFFRDFSENNIYTLSSNVYNLSDDELEAIKKNYIIIKTFEKNNVRVELLKKK